MTCVPPNKRFPFQKECVRSAVAPLSPQVKYWITFNEAFVVSWLGYGIAVFAPGVYDPGVGVYRVAHNIIRSHSRAYRVYDDNFRGIYGGGSSHGK